MRAVRIHSYNNPLEATTLPDVSPRPREVKVAIAACGICHSDAHYRSGFGDTSLPRTPGHEIAGVISEVGSDVSDLRIGDRVAIHYLVTCGTCRNCREHGEQFCERGEMIGKHRDGGYAESIVVPALNAIPIPPNVSFEAAAIMMCSTATAYHALRLAQAGPRERVAILGFGGLGVSAFHLAKLLGAESITVIDIVPEKLRAAEALGAQDVDQFDIAVDFTGRAEVIASAFRRLAPGGCLVLVALSEAMLPLNPYRDVLAKERRLIGCSDHLREELVELLRFAANGELDVSPAISRRVPLDAAAINAVLDELDRGTEQLRSVILRG